MSCEICLKFELGTMHGKRVFRFRNVKKRDCSQTSKCMSWQLLRKHNNVATRYQKNEKNENNCLDNVIQIKLHKYHHLIYFFELQEVKAQLTRSVKL